MNPNSALIWYPATKDLMPTPKTIMIPYDHANAVCFLDDGSGKREAWFDCLESVQQAAQQIGFPVFIRTDLASAKHSGPKAYKADRLEDVGQVLAETLFDNEMKFCFERGPESIMVRQFLDLRHSFTAFNGFPVSREWRFFADARTNICAHPYWLADALEDHVDDATIPWRRMLQEINELPANYGMLCAKAMEAVAACGDDRWSIDFAQDRDGEWWLIDMARMKNSWHWPGCPNGQVKSL